MGLLMGQIGQHVGQWHEAKVIESLKPYLAEVVKVAVIEALASERERAAAEDRKGGGSRDAPV